MDKENITKYLLIGVAGGIGSILANKLWGYVEDKLENQNEDRHERVI